MDQRPVTPDPNEPRVPKLFAKLLQDALEVYAEYLEGGFEPTVRRGGYLLNVLQAQKWLRYHTYVGTSTISFAALTLRPQLGNAKITATHSEGQDNALVIFVDTEFEPDASDGGPGLRIILNDEPVYTGVEFLCPDCGGPPSDPNHDLVHFDAVN